MNKRLYFASLYFAEGAPIGFIWWALPAILAERGFALSDVSQLTALAALPWSIKFFAAPVVDLLSRKIGLKAPLLFAQIIMAATALAFFPAIEAAELGYLTLILLLHSSFAAIQDVCIDALAVKSVPEEEMGRVNGAMQAGMLVGRSIFGGASLMLIHQLGLRATCFALSAAILFSAVALFSRKEPKEPNEFNVSEYLSGLKLLLMQKQTWLLVATAFVASLSFEGLAGIASAALVKVGMPAHIRGPLYAIGVPLSMMAGALFGGKLADSFDKGKLLRYATKICALTAVITAGLMDLAVDHSILASSMILFYCTIGFLTASLYAYLMTHTNKSFPAFAFSLFMAVTNLSESSSTLVVGKLVGPWGYAVSAAIPALLSLSVVILIISKSEGSKLPN
tara:strand:- start:23840 stop:25024 length:1185 start_codon:yes stop_codon:yes gene_type:complete